MDLAIIVINFVNINNTFPREKEKEEERRGGEREREGGAKQNNDKNAGSFLSFSLKFYRARFIYFFSLR